MAVLTGKNVPFNHGAAQPRDSRLQNMRRFTILSSGILSGVLFSWFTLPAVLVVGSHVFSGCVSFLALIQSFENVLALLRTSFLLLARRFVPLPMIIPCALLSPSSRE